MTTHDPVAAAPLAASDGATLAGAAKSQPAIEIIALCKIYGTTLAVDGPRRRIIGCCPAAQPSSGATEGPSERSRCRPNI